MTDADRLDACLWRRVGAVNTIHDKHTFTEMYTKLMKLKDQERAGKQRAAWINQLIQASRKR